MHGFSSLRTLRVDHPAELSDLSFFLPFRFFRLLKFSRGLLDPFGHWESSGTKKKPKYFFCFFFKYCS